MAGSYQSKRTGSACGTGVPRRLAPERVFALLDTLLCFKLDNRHLVLALEGTGDDSPYRAEHYGHWHALLESTLRRIPDLPDPAFTAHALLAATRADLVEHLAGHEGVPRETLRAHLATFTARVLNGPAV